MTPRWCLDCSERIEPNGKRSLPHRCEPCRRARALRNARERQRKFHELHPQAQAEYARAFRQRMAEASRC